MAHIMVEDRLEQALEKFCDKLIEKGIMKPEDKQKAVQMVKGALLEAYPDGVPQDLLTDPAKQKTLLVALIAAPLMEKNPTLKFDLGLFFKAEFNLKEAQTFFKTFLNELNKLEPNPEKRLSEKELEKKLDALTNKIEREIQQQQDANEYPRFVDSPSANEELEEVFESLFGMTQFGNAVALSVNKGNTSGVIDSYSATSARGGSIHEGRDLPGDSSVDPYVTRKAEERLLGLGGIGAGLLDELKSAHLISESPKFKPPQAK